jgi:hypothetical protein
VNKAGEVLTQFDFTIQWKWQSPIKYISDIMSLGMNHVKKEDPLPCHWWILQYLLWEGRPLHVGYRTEWGLKGTCEICQKI